MTNSLPVSKAMLVCVCKGGGDYGVLMINALSIPISTISTTTTNAMEG